MNNKQFRQLVKVFELWGGTVKEKKNGFMFFAPDGQPIAMRHLTTSDQRATKNFLADLKRSGFQP